MGSPAFGLKALLLQKGRVLLEHWPGSFQVSSCEMCSKIPNVNRHP